MKEKPVYNNLYWLRAISCLSVVLIHAITITLSNFNESRYEYAEYIQLIFMYATPSFVIISEFLIANAYKESLPHGFFKNRINSLLIPYISTGLIFAAVFASNFTDFLNKVVQYVILADSIGYFVLIILQFYLLHFLLSKYLKQMNPIIYLCSSFIITVLYLMFFQLTNAPNIVGAEYFWGKGYFLLIPAWLFYFSFGYFLGTHYSKIEKAFDKHFKFYSISFLFFMLVVVGFKYLGLINSVSSKRIDMLLYTVAFVLFILALFRKSKSIPNFVGFINKYSFNIYLVHVLPMNLIDVNISDSFWINVLLLFVIGILFSVLFSNILNSTKHGYLIIGKTLKVRKRSTCIHTKPTQFFGVR